MVKQFTFFIQCFILLLVTFLVNVTKTAFCQDAILSQYFSTPIFINPAFAGTSEGYRLVLNFRNHPLPDASNFSTINATADAFFPKLDGGIGLLANSDYQGALTWRNNISAIYAYHLQINQNWNLNFGAQAGYIRRDIYWGNFEFTDPNQPPPESHWKDNPDFASGILVFSEWLYGGLAAHHLARPKESWFGEERLPIKYTAHIGFNIEPRKNRRANTLRYDYFISPNIIFQSQGRFQRINYGLYAGVETVMVGIWLRQDLKTYNTLVFLIGFTQGKLNLGYSYDYSLSGFTDRMQGVHELSLAFKLASSDQNLKNKILNCPLF